MTWRKQLRQRFRACSPTLDVAYIDDTYPFMLSHERERFIDALRSVALLNE